MSVSPRPPTPNAATRPVARWESAFALLFLLGATIWFGWAVTRGWDNGNLPGHEFRQAQTAISTYWIRQDRDFSLAYPTPVLGRPWSVPMEFPLYQWTVALFAETTGLALVPAGRAVAIACLLLALPAVFLLLRRIGLAPARATVATALLLTCPLHVFYARAFLIETMALMFALWFLLGFVETLRARRFGWLLLAAVAGAAAGGVKATTFIVYLVPAALWGGAELLRAWRHRTGSWRPVLGVLAWGLGAVVVPFAATLAWTRYADAVKALNPNGAFLVSGNLTGFNFGLGANNLRGSVENWGKLLETWSRGIMPLPLLGVVTALALWRGSRWRLAAVTAGASFVAAQLIFPLLYSLHEYYFVANATLLLAAVGLTLAGLWESTLPRLVPLAFALALAFLQANEFRRSYLPAQTSPSYGGTATANLLAEITTEREVLVIAGEDWNSATPFFAGRRALMLRRDTENDWPAVEQAFAALHDEPVAALLLTGDQRDNAGLRERASLLLDIDPEPAFALENSTIHLRRSLAGEFSSGLHGSARIPDLRRYTETEVEVSTLRPRDRRIFSMMKPEPIRFCSQFGAGTFHLGDGRAFIANPLTRLWFAAPAGAKHGRIEFGLVPGAYANPDAASDGIELRVSTVSGEIEPRMIASRTIDPRNLPADRGVLRLEFTFDPLPGTTILVEALPGPSGSGAYDWSFISRLELF